jgi:hypothetical protein
MRMTMGAFLLLGLATGGPARADDQAECLKIVDKAIQATGGLEKLQKVKAATWKAKGKIYVMGLEIPFTGESAEQLPGQFKFAFEGEVMGQKFVFVEVINGDRGWVKMGDDVMEMDKDQLAEAREELHATWVGYLYPLKDKAFTLAPLGEVKVEDRPAVGIKASYKDRRDVNLYFDKETGLPVKVEHRVHDEMSGMEVNQETFLSDYQDFDGIKWAVKFVIKRDGKPFLEGEITEFKHAEKLDDGVFAKP